MQLTITHEYSDGVTDSTSFDSETDRDPTTCDDWASCREAAQKALDWFFDGNPRLQRLTDTVIQPGTTVSITMDSTTAANQRLRDIHEGRA